VIQGVFVVSKWPTRGRKRVVVSRPTALILLFGTGGQSKATTGPSFPKEIRVSNDDYSMTKLMIDTMVFKNEPKTNLID